VGAGNRLWRAYPGVLAIPLALVAVLALGGLAVAALEQRPKAFDVAASEHDEGTATCRPGQTAVSAGFQAPLNGGEGPSMLAMDSTREGESRWRFRANNLGSDGKAKAYAYCDSRNVNISVVSESFPVEDNSLGSGTVECAGNRAAVAGGFDFPEPDNANLVGSRRVGEQGWTLSVFNATGDSADFEVFVYCRRGGPALSSRSNSIRADESERYRQSVTAECNGSKEARSGGFETQYEGEGELADIGIVHTSKRKGTDRWKATAFAPIGDPKITVWAYCQ
jgi:hypothetical protein